METVRLTESNVAELAQKAAGILSSGGVVLYPTDTLYGLGGNALSDDAVMRVIRIKGRDDRKPIHAIVPDIDMAERYADVSKTARRLVQEFGGKVTLVLPKKEGVQTGIAKYRNTFGIRIPDNELCRAMSRAFDGPVTTTSANRADMLPEHSVDAILSQLYAPDRFGVLQNTEIDFVIDGGESTNIAPSTVIDLSGETPVILREAAVPAAEIWSVLRSDQ